jgi:endo-1,4-beta-xylanase
MVQICVRAIGVNVDNFTSFIIRNALPWTYKGGDMAEVVRVEQSSKTRRNRVLIGAALASVMIGGALVAYEHHDAKAGAEVTQSGEIVQSADMLHADWSSVPGVEKQDTALAVTPTDLRIVEQDGGGGQSNPSVNVGNYLEVPDGFAVSMTMDDTPGATVQVYGDLPVIADEFRVERPSVQLTVKDAGHIAVRMWDGQSTHDLTNQQPVFDETFVLKEDEPATITMAHQDGSLRFAIDGEDAGEFTDHNIFDQNKVWLGLSATEKPWNLNDLSVTSTGSEGVKLMDAMKTEVSQDDDGFQKLADQKRPGFKIGTAAALYPATADEKYQNLLFGGNFGQITLENASKWQFTEPIEGTYTFQQMDTLVNLARQHNMTVNGHAAGAFGEALPKWVQDLPTATDEDKAHVKQVLIDHIKAEVGHFKGRVATWDIVNEPLADYDEFEAGHVYRDNIWYKAMGEDYIAVALRAAHEADPDAKLTINDFGLEDNSERLDVMLGIVQRLKAEGIPVDSIGLESHVYDFDQDKIDPNTLRTVIKRLGQTGVTAHISELDVDDSRGQQRQARQYADILKACLAEPNCTSYSVWGFYDKYDRWQDNDHSLQTGADLLWDERGRATPAVDKLRQILDR